MTRYEQAVKSVMHVLKRAEDWQEGQDYLANHKIYGAWIREQFPDELEQLAVCQQIIRDAEERLGDEIPY